MSEIDEICQKISPQAYTFDLDSAQQRFAIYCSKTPLPQEISGSIERIIILKINLSESGVVIKMEELSESGNEPDLLESFLKFTFQCLKKIWKLPQSGKE